MVRRGRGSARDSRGGKSQHGGANSSQYTPWQTSGSSQPYFSLGEEARYTERHRSWNSDLKLRHLNVAFVSAGNSSAEQLTHIRQEERKGNVETSSPIIHSKTTESSHAPNNNSPRQFTIAEMPMSKMSLSDKVSREPSDPSRDLKLRKSPETTLEASESVGKMVDSFFIDITGSGKPVSTGFLYPTLRRSPSPTYSDSSEEIIIFTGRNRSQTKPGSGPGLVNAPHEARSLQGRVQAKSLSHSYQSAAKIVDDPVNNIRKGSSLSRRTTARLVGTSLVSMVDIAQARAGRGTKGNDVSRKKVQQCKRGKCFRKVEEEAEAFADYIDNVRGSHDLDELVKKSPCNVRDLGGSDNAEWKDEAEEEQADGVIKGLEGWDSADLQDFDELSTSSEGLDIIEKILSRRERSSGLQYLVIGAGYTMDDARWLPLSALKAPGVQELIEEFEEEHAKSERHLDNESDDSLQMDDQIALDLQEQMAFNEVEKDLEERRRARMTDEQIAGLLSKQEELGLGSEALKLFDGQESDAEDEIEPQLDGMWDAASPFRFQSKSKNKKRTKSNLPSATAFADVLDEDQYNGFDIVGQDRPSLHKKSKGRSGKTPLNLSDSEFEQQINMAWENDRNKKKRHKQEREELRAWGLLGKKGKPGFKANYREGMSMTELKNEIKDFLMSPRENLSLPPMAQRERKSVHEIANVLKLKSKSNGTGISRYPVLYKTSRTIQYDDEAFGSIEALLPSRRFHPRMDRPKKRGTPSAKGRGGGFATAGASYRDGEIVGAAAPELGQENRGRVMLERMGWSTGTALGALNNNSGIVQPIAQVVKTGKAGLG